MFQRVSVSTGGQPAIYDAVADGVDTVKLRCGTRLPATYRYPCAHVHKRAASQTDASAHTSAGTADRRRMLLFWPSNRDSPWQCTL